MDYSDPDSDAVKRFERWEKALELLSLENNVAYEITRYRSAFARMKREAIINAAQQEGDEHLPRLQKAFPDFELAPFIRALRVKYVEMRLSGELE